MTILLIDDHVAVQRGLEEILTSNLRVTRFGRAANSREATQQVQAHRWDVAVVDLSLPGLGGLELIRDLKSLQPAMRILVYSMHNEDQFGVRALRAGADGYLTKDSPADEIPKAVRNVVATGRHITPSLAAAMAQTIADGDDPAGELLSDREYQVLQKIASGKTPTEIAGELAVSIKTVSTYRSRMLEKLKLKTTADLIRYAVEKKIV